MEQKIYNAGFEIMDMVKTHKNGGYAWGQSKTQYVTWEYRTNETGEVSFFYGHYFPRNPEMPAQSKALCLADFHKRLGYAFDLYAKFGYTF